MSKEHKSTIKQQVMIKTIKKFGEYTHTLGNKYTKKLRDFRPGDLHFSKITKFAST